jgi:predicted nucleotidyltransferase
LITTHWREHIAGNEQVVTKKLLYILRSALTLDWLATHPGKLPPMNIYDLIAGVVLDTD